MRGIKYILLAWMFVPFVSLGQSQDENYVMTTKLLNKDATHSIKSVQYYDGLGKPTVAVSNTGGKGQSSYVLTTYDVMGREDRKYLPVAASAGALYYKSPSDIIIESRTVYNGDNTAYTKNNYDALDRIVSVEQPGMEWRNANKRTVIEYGANKASDNVLHYEVNTMNGTLKLSSQNYPAGALIKETSMDADGKKVESFKDILGHEILRRVDGTNDTYYVYDEAGQLCHVLSPMYQKNSTKGLFSYEYKYDGNGNLVKKILPGCEYEQYWYDQNGRLTFMQDKNLRDKGKYRFFLYDNFSRLAIQGLCSDIKTKDDGVEGIPAVTYYEEAAGFLNTGYSFNSTELMKNPELELVSYYDGHLGNECFSILANSTKLSDSFANQVIEGKLASISSGKNLPARLISGYPKPDPVPFDTTGMATNIADTIPFLKRLPKKFVPDTLRSDPWIPDSLSYVPWEPGTLPSVPWELITLHPDTLQPFRKDSDFRHTFIPPVNWDSLRHAISIPAIPSNSSEYGKIDMTGMLTGKIVKLSNGKYIHTAFYYDERGNLTDVDITHSDGYIENTHNTYTFTNQVKSSTTAIKKDDKEILSTITNNDYNIYNDKLENYALKVSTQNRSDSTHISYVYDDLGRLSLVIRPDNVGEVRYDYDLHGWITNISTNSFKEQLHYADGYGTPCYNGNISSLTWSNGIGNNKGYKFEYDGLNRLTSSVYGENDFSMNDGRYNESMTFDANGNILSVARNGMIRNGVYGTVDDAAISYNGNQIKDVTEKASMVTSNGAMDIKQSSDQFAYDGNGSLTIDGTRDIALIEYDDWNNPRCIQFANGNVTEYVYSAEGQKLRTIHYTAMPNISVQFGEKHELGESEVLCVDSTDYLIGGSLLLNNGKVDKYLFSGGYCQNTDSTLAFNYFNQDHLGNNREVVDSNGKVVQTNNYYPFGTPFYDEANTTNASLQPFKYNGKELDMMHGLNTYDYGARQYYAALPVWDRVDPLAEKYRETSPYVYCANNPVNKFDPDGQDWYQRNNVYYWDPKVKSQKDLSSGKYIGETINEKGISYRNDGTILFDDPQKAYKRLVYTSHHSYKKKREQSAFILGNGKVLIMSDNWNDNLTSKHVGYKILSKNTLIGPHGEKYSIKAQVHTHPSINSSKGLSVDPYGADDVKFAKSVPGLPIFILHADGNLYGGVGRKNGPTEVFFNNPIGKVQNVLNGLTPLDMTADEIRELY